MDKLAETVAEQGLEIRRHAPGSGHLFFAESETIQICTKPHVSQT